MGPEISWNRVYRQPQVSLARPTPLRMGLVSLSAALGICQSALSGSPSTLLLVLAAVSAALPADWLLEHFQGGGRKLRDGSALASVLVLCLLLPDRLPPLLAALGALFAIGVAKHSFGGLGANWLNPALGAWLFIRASWPSSFSAALEGAVPGAGMDFLPDFSAFVRAFLNRRLFALFGAELPADYPSFFFSAAPGIIADRGVLALLAGTILLSAFQAIRVWVPALFLGLYAILVRLGGAESPWSGDVIAGLFSGGTLVAAFFLLPEPSSGAKSAAGAALGAAFAALFAFLFRYPGGEPLGVIFAAVLVNALNPLIRVLESRLFYVAGGDVPVPFGKPKRQAAGEAP